ncbi:hypothetical protein OH76DRAFT_935138 [Lentinus brumalis]|uniref:Uncharacterized protein n=1 Tax=Lentinus brumalis TaxID=2498619 RepID=A0A371CZB4_9APHY|nr:hypothetical protein OH76DRAFT_935138 [Polyporus brumalis]
MITVHRRISTSPCHECVSSVLTLGQASPPLHSGIILWPSFCTLACRHRQASRIDCHQEYTCKEAKGLLPSVEVRLQARSRCTPYCPSTHPIGPNAVGSSCIGLRSCSRCQRATHSVSFP